MDVEQVRAAMERLRSSQWLSLLRQSSGDVQIVLDALAELLPLAECITQLEGGEWWHMLLKKVPAGIPGYKDFYAEWEYGHKRLPTYSKGWRVDADTWQQAVAALAAKLREVT